ncbi:FCP1-like domain, HAD-like domain protein [Artemisia annua]|uniref:FCP1-like domain, HAD-like domain protein n=1 Tax=Artemisia annua TaxID=35608 RepID=A0A2U1N130_ARTAN|nr:FCP1-like domain, HAD-like domain protein [Artemisia annua]
MEYHSPPVKRRRVLHADKPNNPDSNKESIVVSPNENRDTSMGDVSNTEVVVNQNDAVDNGKEILMAESPQIECSDLDLKRHEGKDKILMDGSNLTTNGESTSKLCVTNSNEDKTPPQVVTEGSKLDACTESTTEFRNEDNLSSQMIVEESTSDTTKDSTSQVRDEDNLPSEMVIDGSNSDASKESGSQVRNEGDVLPQVVMEGAKLDASKESSSQIRTEDNVYLQTAMEGSKLDASKESSSKSRNEDNLPSQINGHPNSRKKLLVLDVNGLIVDIVAHPDEKYKPDTIIGRKAVYKRPYCDEFLKFCFERFNVGVWTSRTRRNIERVLDFLMKDTQKQFIFCWDQSHCTETGFNTLDNSDKPLLLKELKKLWDKQDPDLSWDRGVYDESNTILLDDSPYKALRNPPYTAIFPHSYSYRDTKDTGLGPEGDLRSYLERLAASDNVQKFIEQNPFGQQPISYTDESWKFYLKVIDATDPRPIRSKRKLVIIDVSGLIADVVSLSYGGGRAEQYRPDVIQGSRAVFKRPYCDDFLQFCFKTFNVGIWSSTSRYNIERVIDFLLRDYQDKLLFCWDRDHCTDTGFRTVENINSTLFLKELRKLWEKKDPDLPWEIGEYDESNTLLVENAPHKALLNPPNTAIFPYPYRCSQTEDNSLGPKGDLRMYLERLAAAEDVQKFVAENPYGQRPIREKNLSWGFYQKVIRAFSSNKPGAHSSEASSSISDQFKNSSEPKADATAGLSTQTLLEPKTEPATVGAAQTLSNSETNTIAALADQTSLEPKTESATVVAAQTLSDSVTNTTAALADQTLLEPKSEPANALITQALLEPEAESANSLANQTLLEPETNTTNASVSETLVEPDTDTTIALVDQPLLEPETKSTDPVSQHCQKQSLTR